MQKLARRIEKLVPQCLMGRNSDGDKRDAIYYAAWGWPWAAMPITALAGSNKTYKSFLDELTTAQQNHRIRTGKSSSNKTRSYIRSAEVSSRRTLLGSADDDGEAEIWFQGQARYGRDMKAPKKKEVSYAKDKKCCNCGDTGHILTKCTKARDDKRTMRHGIKDLIKSQAKENQILTLKQSLSDKSEHVNVFWQISSTIHIWQKNTRQFATWIVTKMIIHQCRMGGATILHQLETMMTSSRILRRHMKCSMLTWEWTLRNPSGP